MVTLLHDRVLLRKQAVETKTLGGIVLTDGAAEKTFEGQVLGVGEGNTTKTGTVIPLTVKVGDVVIYDPTKGQTVKINGEELLIVKEEEIFCIKETDTK